MAWFGQFPQPREPILQLLLDLVPALGVSAWCSGGSSLTRRSGWPLLWCASGCPWASALCCCEQGLRWQLFEAALIALLAIGLDLLCLRGLSRCNSSLHGSALQLGGVVGNTAYFRHSRSPGTAATWGGDLQRQLW